MQNNFCINHPDRKIKAKGLCASCYNKQFWKPKTKRKNKETPKNNRKRQLKNRYGITIEEYDEMLSNQNGGCAICGKTTAYNNGTKRLHIDHDHKTNLIRGLLCSQCNTTLGHLEKIGIDNFISYLIKIKEKNNE